MKQILLAFFIVLFLLPAIVYSHGAGYPPFFKIERKIAEVYPLQNVGVYSSNLDIPQDIAHRNFVVGEKIPFEIDTAVLENVFPPDVIKKAKFTWDFGDGSKKEGTKNTHVYKKPGSYILSITADYQDPATPPELIESVLIQVLPNKEYQLPKAVVSINNKKGTRENYNILDFDLNNRLEFDASESVAGSAKIISYTWDFGDDKNANVEKVEHQYQLPQAFATVVLRVEDENGLFADAFVNVRNSGSNVPKSPQVQGIAMIAGPVLIAFIAAIVGIYLKSRRKRKNT